MAFSAAMNAAMLAAECAVAVIAPQYWYLYAGGIALVMLVLNAKILIDFVRATFSGLRRRGKA